MNMKGSIFQPISTLYTLKTPKTLPPTLLPLTQTLTLAFYSHIFTHIIKTPPTQTLLAQYKPVPESIREAYTNLFYSCTGLKPGLLDFVACLVCLLSDAIFVSEAVQADQGIARFLERVTADGGKVREYLFVVYTEQTIGYRVGRQSAALLFNRYIISQNHFQSNLSTKLRIHLQLKQFKQNLENRESVDIRPRLKKRTRNANASHCQNQINEVMMMSRVQVEEERRKERKFQKLGGRCRTEGAEAVGREKGGVAKLSHFLKTIRNCQLFISKVKKGKQNREYSRSFEHWRAVLDEIKTNTHSTQNQKIPPLSPRHTPNQLPTHNPSIPQPQQPKPPPSRSTQQKRTLISPNNILPDIKHYKQHIIIEDDENSHTVQNISYNSRRYRQELSLFISERKGKRIQ